MLELVLFIYFLNIIFHKSTSVMDCLVPFSKPLLLKSAMCSDWSAQPVCCDWKCFRNVLPYIVSFYKVLTASQTRTNVGRDLV